MKARGLGVVVAAALLASTVCTSPVLAQGGGGGGGGGGRGGGPGALFGGMGMGRGGFGQQQFDPSINSRELENYGKVLGLDSAQKDAVKSLFEAYQQQFDSAAKPARAKLDAARQEARESGDPTVLRDVQKDMETFAKARTDLEKGFFSDFKAVLNEQQMQKWPKLERTRRRTQTIGRGLMSGERVDVVKLVDDLQLTPEAQATLAPILEQYETDLDRTLQERNKVYEEVQGKIGEMFRNNDQAAMEEVFKKGREVSVRVRDTNRQYARQVEAQLPEDKRAPFNESVRKESFPRVYTPVYATRVIDAALALPDLEQAQKDGLTSLRDTFNRDLTAVNRDMEGATEEQEMTLTPQSMMQRMGGGDEGKLTELRRKKRELGNEAVDKVKALLNEEQVKKLPAREQGDGGRGGGGGREDNAPRQRRGRPAEPPPPPPDRG